MRKAFNRENTSPAVLEVNIPEDHGATEKLYVGEDEVVVQPRRYPGDTYPPLWFYFEVRAAPSRPTSPVRVTIQDLTPGADTYEPFWKHCLWSWDGLQWERIPPVSQRYGETTLTVDAELPSGGSLWIAETYPLPLRGYLDLYRELSKPPATGLQWDRWTCGHSVQGRPIEAFRLWLEGASPERTLMLLAGQHAVEQSGKIFAETVLRGYHSGRFAGTPMADLLEHYSVVVIPLANPDGCYDGRMNSNAAGQVMDAPTDDSPEMQAALAVVDEFRPAVLVNCHGWGNEWGQPPYEDLYRWTDEDALFAYLRRHVPGCSSSASPHWLGEQFRLENEARQRWGTECLITELNWNSYLPPEGGPPVRPTRAQIESRAVEYLTAIARYLKESAGKRRNFKN